MEICDFLKSWKRMCNSMTEMNGCEDCPIVKNTHDARCGDMPGEIHDVESIAREVEKWAAEHPEPIYPTWMEWLAANVPGADAESIYDAVQVLNRTRIPADTAQKLGVEPKEG